PTEEPLGPPKSELRPGLADDPLGWSVRGLLAGQAEHGLPETKRRRAAVATRIQVPGQASTLLDAPLLPGVIHQLLFREVPSSFREVPSPRHSCLHLGHAVSPSPTPKDAVKKYQSKEESREPKI